MNRVLWSMDDVSLQGMGTSQGVRSVTYVPRLHHFQVLAQSWRQWVSCGL
jgi:hypothetical protein